MIERVEGMVLPPVVGKRYWVPCVLVPRQGIGSTPGGWWPVNGRLHDDADIGVPEEHYHFDPRFMTKRQFASKVRFWVRRVELLMPPGSRSDESDVLLSVLPDSEPRSLRQDHRRMTCVRAMPTFPRDRVLSSWLPGLEEAHKDVVAKNCRTCPHRGLPLASLPADEHGVVTCSGHGLRWNRATGALVRDGQVC